MAWFHSFQAGKVANRFASDVSELDWMAGNFWWTMTNVFKFFASVLLVGISSPAFLGLIVPILPVYLWIGWFYRFTERAVKRIASAKNSPLMALLGETIDGAQLIRAFKRTEMFADEFQRRSLNRIRALYYQTLVNTAGNAWLQVSFVHGLD